MERCSDSEVEEGEIVDEDEYRHLRLVLQESRRQLSERQDVSSCVDDRYTRRHCDDLSFQQGDSDFSTISSTETSVVDIFDLQPHETFLRKSNYQDVTNECLEDGEICDTDDEYNTASHTLDASPFACDELNNGGIEDGEFSDLEENLNVNPRIQDTQSLMSDELIDDRGMYEFNCPQPNIPFINTSYSINPVLDAQLVSQENMEVEFQSLRNDYRDLDVLDKWSPTCVELYKVDKEQGGEAFSQYGEMSSYKHIEDTPRNRGVRRGMENSILTERTLEKLLQKESKTIIRRILELADELKTFPSTLKNITQLTLFLKVINRGFTCDSMSEALEDIADVLKEDDFIYDIVNYIDSYLNEGNGDNIQCKHALEELLQTVNHVCESTLYSIVFIIGIYGFVETLVGRITNLNIGNTQNISDLFKVFKEIKTRCILRRRKIPDKNLTKGECDTNRPQNSFRNISVFPQASDINTDKNVFFRPNKIVGNYQNLDDYLDTQFRLLREDYVGCLRNGIKEYMEDADSNKHTRYQDIKVYNQVTIVSPICGERLNHVISFRRFKNIKWHKTKRLKSNSLLCLSSDKFKTCYFATVVDNGSVALRQKGLIHVQFSHTFQITKTIMGEIFTMVETAAFFEAYKHVLTSLQTIETGTLPFENYIVNCTTEVLPPKYLQDNPEIDFDLRPLHDVTTVVHGSSFFREPEQFPHPFQRNEFSMASQPLKHVKVLGDNWPDPKLLQIDDSQLKAVKAALTREFCIIQGPPGCGKTYVGLKIVKALLHNKRVWSDPFNFGNKDPLLILCYTNHALDQFMKGICSIYDGDVVRVGGRKTCEDMEKHSLYNIRKSFRETKMIPYCIYRGKKVSQADINGAKRRLNLITIEIKQIKENIVHEKALYDEMGKKYADQFEFNGFSHIRLPNRLHFLGNSAIVKWLGIVDKANEIQQQILRFGIKSISEKDNECYANDVPHNRYDEHLETMDIEFENELKLDKPQEQYLDSLLALNLDTISIKPEWMMSRKWKEKIRWERLMLTDWINEKLSTYDCMSNEELVSVNDIFSDRFSIKNRWRLYLRWISEKILQLNGTVERDVEYFEEACTRSMKARNKEDKLIMSMASVICMTTTCAAKHHSILREIKPKIIIVEEAAEVFESHVVSNLTSGCQQLILIGDHKQLRPKPTVYKLELEYNLHISLFERMIMNGIHHDCLNTQHRMRPSIADNVRFIYKDLQDHQCVLEYDNIKGVEHNTFFINHDKVESNDTELDSFTNEHEAKYMVALCKYFLQQGYPPDAVTILTTYIGQMYTIRKYMDKTSTMFEKVLVSVVDNYQGEENDIILLSLVRSNAFGRIGFLKHDNRVCVALSRAKKGMYVIGNFDTLSKTSSLWKEITDDAKGKGLLANAMALMCSNHPMERVIAETAEDFLKTPEGGCKQMCDMRLECGHTCPKYCHITDKDHIQAVSLCRKPCERKCKNGHTCRRICSEHVEKCTTHIIITLQMCGHVVEVLCCTEVENYKCETIVKLLLPKCGHQVSIKCKFIEDNFICRSKCGQTVECGHLCNSICGLPTLNAGVSETAEQVCFVGHSIACKENCNTLLDCGHTCNGTCTECLQGRLHVKCVEKCRCHLVCGHTCSGKCGECLPCEAKCERRCFHNVCSKSCKDVCDPCYQACIWKCPHYECTKTCSEPCDRPRCNIQCQKRLPCRHSCIGLCGDTCPTKCRKCDKAIVTEIRYGGEDDSETRFVQLEDCGHIIKYDVMDEYMDIDDEVCLKRCPVCKTPVRNTLRYKSNINTAFQRIERTKLDVLYSNTILDNVPVSLDQTLLQIRNNHDGGIPFVRQRRKLNLMNQLRIRNSLTKLSHKNAKGSNSALQELNALFINDMHSSPTSQWLVDTERESCRYIDTCMLKNIEDEHLTNICDNAAIVMLGKHPTEFVNQRNAYSKDRRNMLRKYLNNSRFHKSLQLQNIKIEVQDIDHTSLSNNLYSNFCESEGKNDDHNNCTHGNMVENDESVLVEHTEELLDTILKTNCSGRQDKIASKTKEHKSSGASKKTEWTVDQSSLDDVSRKEYTNDKRKEIKNRLMKQISTAKENDNASIEINAHESLDEDNALVHEKNDKCADAVVSNLTFGENNTSTKATRLPSINKTDLDNENNPKLLYEKDSIMLSSTIAIERDNMQDVGVNEVNHLETSSTKTIKDIAIAEPQNIVFIPAKSSDVTDATEKLELENKYKHSNTVLITVLRLSGKPYFGCSISEFHLKPVVPKVDKKKSHQIKSAREKETIKTSLKRCYQTGVNQHTSYKHMRLDEDAGRKKPPTVEMTAHVTRQTKDARGPRKTQSARTCDNKKIHSSHKQSESGELTGDRMNDRSRRSSSDNRRSKGRHTYNEKRYKHSDSSLQRSHKDRNKRYNVYISHDSHDASRDTKHRKPHSKDNSKRKFEDTCKEEQHKTEEESKKRSKSRTQQRYSEKSSKSHYRGDFNDNRTYGNNVSANQDLFINKKEIKSRKRIETAPSYTKCEEGDNNLCNNTKGINENTIKDSEEYTLDTAEENECNEDDEIFPENVDDLMIIDAVNASDEDDATENDKECLTENKMSG